MEVNLEGFQIAGSGAVKVGDRLVAEENGEHAAETVNLYRHASLSCCLFQTAGQDGAKAFCTIADVVLLHVGESSDACGHSQRIAAKRAGLIHRAGRRNHLHDFALAAIGCNRQTAADNLAKAGDVGVDVIEGLAAALSATEAAHNLVADEQSAVLLRQRAYCLKEAVVRQD